MIRLWITVVVAASGLSCSSPTPPTLCTDAGCDSGLWVELDQAAPDGTVISIEAAPGLGPAWTVTCGIDTPCTGRIFFGGMVAPSVVITITNDAGTVVSDYQPEYEGQYPNGPSCEPVCPVATIRVALPSNEAPLQLETEA